jgi:hypothetical protein
MNADEMRALEGKGVYLEITNRLGDNQPPYFGILTSLESDRAAFLLGGVGEPHNVAHEHIVKVVVCPHPLPDNDEGGFRCTQCGYGWSE